MNLALEEAFLGEPMLGSLTLSRKTGASLLSKPQLEQLLEDLEISHWKLRQDMERTGSTDRSEYDLAFARARAVNAAIFAQSEDQTMGPLEAVYEAIMAIGFAYHLTKSKEILEIVDSLIQGRPFLDATGR